MGRTIVSLRIEPAEGTLIVGRAVQLSLFGATAKGGTDLIPGNMAQWTTSSPDVAEINRQGRLNPRRAGRVTITARYGGQVAAAVVTITAQPDPGA